MCALSCVEVFPIWVWARHGQSGSSGASPDHVRRKEKSQTVYWGGWSPIHIHLLQLYCCLALPWQPSSGWCSSSFGYLPRIWWWHCQRWHFFSSSFLMHNDVGVLCFQGKISSLFRNIILVLTVTNYGIVPFKIPCISIFMTKFFVFFCRICHFFFWFCKYSLLFFLTFSHKFFCLFVFVFLRNKHQACLLTILIGKC